MERQKGVTVNYPQIIAESPVGAAILLADGNIELRVEEKAAQVLRCRVVVGGVLRSQVGINFPGHSLSVPALTAKDYDDLAFGLAQGVDFVALSYVRSARGCGHGPGVHPPPGRRYPHHRQDRKA